MPPSRRSRKRKRDPNFVVIKVFSQNSPAALANNTAFAETMVSLDDDLYLIAADLLWSMNDHTVAEGPITVGIASSSMTAANITEAVDASPTNRGDTIALERAKRPVRKVGDFSGATLLETLNNGTPIRTRMRFPLSHNQTLNSFSINRSGATLTTGTVIKITGELYARWT